MFKTFAIVTFDKPKAKKVFALLRAIRECGTDVGNSRQVAVMYYRPKRGHHGADISVYGLAEYELAPIRDLLTAVENLGANVEYFG